MKSPEKIVVLTSWYPSREAPLNGIFVQEQAQELSRLYNVVIVALQIVSWRTIIRQRQLLTTVVENRGPLTVYRLYFRPPALARHVALWYWLAAKQIELAFRTVLQTTGKPDLLHAHVVLPAGYFAVQLGRTYDIKVVLTEHSGPFSVHLDTEVKRKLVQQTLLRCDRVVAVSPALAKQISAFTPQIVPSVVSNLIRTKFFQPSPLKRSISIAPIRFLLVGLLTEVKGVSHLLKAAQRLKWKGYENFQLVIGGEGPLRLSLEQMAKDGGLDKQCKFLGHLNREQTRNEMQQCDVLILASLHETFGIVLVEAMACGKPVIATRCGGPDSIVTQETGILVEPANSEELAVAMASFIEGQYQFSPERIRRYAVENFGEDVFLRNITQVYQTVCSAHDAS